MAFAPSLGERRVGSARCVRAALDKPEPLNSALEALVADDLAHVMPPPPGNWSQVLPSRARLARAFPGVIGKPPNALRNRRHPCGPVGPGWQLVLMTGPGIP